MLSGKSILITGGTGSFGKSFTKTIVEQYPDISRLVIYSRDEQKQFQMSHEYPHDKYPFIRFFIGDIRDHERLKRALKGIDYVVHAAAMKHIHIAEYNPMECIKTNVIGAENLINACLETEVKKVVALSTDKAAAPINLYGATKLVSDKLFIASVVRYGNVMGSNGSVVPFFLKKRKEGVLPITHPDMTRFNITLYEAVGMVLHALEHAWGGEIFVPKIPSFKIVDLAEAIDPTCDTIIVGLRPGEKIHEEMITASDSYYTYDLGRYYAILSNITKWKLDDFIDKFNAVKVKEGFCYNSGNNQSWLNIDDLRSLIKKTMGN